MPSQELCNIGQSVQFRAIGPAYSLISVVCAFLKYAARAGYAASGFCTLLWKLSIACVN
jgi:hypothetical protein